jgi:hypothetical protein
MKKCFLLILIFSGLELYAQQETIFSTHKVVLDNYGKILPWYTPEDKAFDHFLDTRWNFIMTRVPDSPNPPPRSLYPQYYFYCAFKDSKGNLEPDTWMNDVGEKIPNWFESARLFYAYSGDIRPMNIVKEMMDYYMSHGTSPSDFAWPNFPYTTTNAGDTIFLGFTNEGHMALHEIQLDHAAEMGLAYYRMFQFSGEKKYLDAAINVADVLAKNARIGNAEKSVWPYRVIMKSGKITSEYGANWTGAYLLLDNLVKANLGNEKQYSEAKEKAKEFMLRFPMKTGYWTDGHSDTHWDINTYKSNLSASNMTLCLFDFPEIDPEWKSDIPRLIKWTEDNFVFRCAPNEPSTMWGANIVGEQDSFMYKMDYQTARYAAECARWYSISGDESYKEKAYRSLVWVTYCNDSLGKAFESPVSKGINSWWSDCYGECPRMFYHAFAAVPEWAPQEENHILYSEGILKEVNLDKQNVQYTTTKPGDNEYLRLAFKPKYIYENGVELKQIENPDQTGYTLKDLGNGDYALTIRHKKAGKIVIQ